MRRRAAAAINSPPPPRSRLALPRFDPQPATKPAEIPWPWRTGKPQDKSEAPAASALADDPTIKGLTDKLIQNPDDANALYRRGQVYAQRVWAYSLLLNVSSGSGCGW